MKFCRSILLAILASAILAFASENDVDSTKNVALDTLKNVTPDSSFRYSHNNILTIMGVMLTHHALRNSETLHNWPFIAFIAPAASTSFQFTKDFNKIFSVTGKSVGSLTPMNIGLTAGLDLSLIHLLEIGVQGNASSAWNYGRTSTFMGVYQPDERTFSQDIFLTEGGFTVTYKASLTLPIMAVLPKSNWTKIILKAAGNLENSFYTGADDGEPWKAGADVRVNGYRADVSGSIMYMLPFEHVNMAMVTAKIGGFLNDEDFDEIYQDYDPDFKTLSITPTLMFKIIPQWSGMVMAPIVRERKYNKSKYESNEELMLKRVGKEWQLNAIMCMLNYIF